MTRRHPERGAAAVVTVLVFSALMGFFALAFNMGLLAKTRTELQNGADSAALAAARSLDGTSDGLGKGRAYASDYSLQHLAYDQHITIDANTPDADLIYGRWHLRANECLFGTSGNDCFEELAESDPRAISAVKIRNGRDGGSHNSPLDLPFGYFVGLTTATVRSGAVAVAGGPGITHCALPLAIAQCVIVNPVNNTLNCADGVAQTLVFSNANADGVGFANLYYPADTQAPSGNWAADVITSNLCNPSNYTVGPAKLQNGNDFGKVIDALRGVDNKGKPVNGQTCQIGQSLSWAVTDAGCPSNPIFQGVQQVVGFVKATITEVTDNQGNPLACPGDTAPTVDGNPKNAIVVKIPCKATPDPGDSGGGRAFNSSDLTVRLVQ